LAHISGKAPPFEAKSKHFKPKVFAPFHRSVNTRRKRASATACAIAPQILLLDEPFGALDEVTARWADFTARTLEAKVFDRPVGHVARIVRVENSQPSSRPKQSAGRDHRALRINLN
jgi:ABC-type arginine transport system ATPase subunit